MSVANADSEGFSGASPEAEAPSEISSHASRSEDVADGTPDEAAPPASDAVSKPSPHASWRPYGVLGIAVAIGFAIGVMGYGDTVAGLVAKIGLPILIIVTGWRHAAVRFSSESPSLAQWLNAKWAEHGGGFYGLVTVFVFLYLEVQTLMAEAANAWTTWQSSPSIAEYNAFAGFLSDQLWSVAISTLIQFSIETVINGIKAGLWPFYGIKHVGLWGLVVAVAVGYGLYTAAQRYVPAFQDPVAASPSLADAPTSPETSTSPEAPTPPDPSTH